MVLLVDLDEEGTDEHIDEHYRRQLQFKGQPLTPNIPNTPADIPIEDERENLNLGSFSRALAAWPVVSSLAQHLDLNTLHNLSATCRQFRVELSQYRSQLVRQTLRCVNDEEDNIVRQDESRKVYNNNNNTRGFSGRLTSGRVSRCARDLVTECRRCGVVVCRNCTIKQPPSSALLSRHRRLCRTCTKCPLTLHTTSPSTSTTPAFTSSAFSPGICTCPHSVYLCLSCGSGIRSSDTTYMRGWTWRSRYSTHLSGLGTGIGEGEAGVECGRGRACFAAREVEKEIDCDSDEFADLRREMSRTDSDVFGFAGSGSSSGSETARRWSGTSYLSQELEGIGGVMKKKVKKRVKVGATVKEYEDERETGLYLEREQEGKERSWCFWCCRVVPGKKDRREEEGREEVERGLGGGGSIQSSPASGRSWRG